MDSPTEETTDASAALLQAILNLSRFHREHEKFYASSPREQAVAVQRHVRSLLALADRWSTTEVSAGPALSPFAGAEDLNADTALQLDGILFMEGEGEPAEIRHLRSDLARLAAESSETGEWLAAAMQAAWDVAVALLATPELADLLGERHRIIANDWQAAEMSRMVGRLLDRAGDVLDCIDFAPRALRADLGGVRTTPRLLYSACELMSRAADLLSESAALVHENERRWRVFRARVVAIVGADAT